MQMLRGISRVRRKDQQQPGKRSKKAQNYWSSNSRWTHCRLLRRRKDQRQRDIRCLLVEKRLLGSFRWTRYNSQLRHTRRWQLDTAWLPAQTCLGMLLFHHRRTSGESTELHLDIGM